MLIGCVLCAPQLGRYSDLIAVEEGAFIVGGVLERECSLFYALQLIALLRCVCI